MPGVSGVKLQVALDGEIGAALSILEQIHPYVDIVELGTPLIFREGLSIAKRIRTDYPQLTILADLKIIDAGEVEASLAFQAGVDIVTVLGLAPDQTILGALKAARNYQKQIMADMMQVQEVIARSLWLFEKGTDFICVHLAHDLQEEGKSPLSSLQYLRENLPHAQLAVAGGVGLDTIEQLKPLSPAIIIVGKAITLADDPAVMAQSIWKKILYE
jgi:3-hexulose-6-phosphate synthase